MTQTDPKSYYLEVIDTRIRKSSHWKNVNFDAARYYKKLDSFIGLPSVVLATIILGFAFYSVGRANTHIGIQITLATLTVLQGCLLIIQLYIKPLEISHNHKETAYDHSNLIRRYEMLKARILSDENISVIELEETLNSENHITKEMHPLPGFILRKYEQEGT